MTLAQILAIAVTAAIYVLVIRWVAVKMIEEEQRGKQIRGAARIVNNS